ncbi:hypothetical protein IM40_11410 (plasmid) [Candidatus Paracaedimonas acanthamoebae]|nr:hypothetical protein IM40_11410 [Candidatus Paracaedimonas acanthamoebae]
MFCRVAIVAFSFFNVSLDVLKGPLDGAVLLYCLGWQLGGNKTRLDPLILLQKSNHLGSQCLNFCSKINGRRNKVENTFYRLKTIFGRKLHSRNWNNQQAETHLICCLLNKMTQAGMPQSVKAD